MIQNKIITNEKKHPLPLAVWCCVDNYDYDDRTNTISTTTLLKPIRQIVLARQNMMNLKVMDVDNLIAVSMGSALHDSVENAWKNKNKAIEAMITLGIDPETANTIYDDTSFEKRLEKPVGDWIVTGKYDLVTQGAVGDVKSSSVYGYMLGSSDWQYKMQMSIYRWLDPVLITDDIGTNFYIFTDWSKLKALQDTRYPQARIQTKQHLLEPVDIVNKYITTKLAAIDKYVKETDQDKIPDCTPEELWQEPNTYAYYKSGNTSGRATKVFKDYSEASVYHASVGNVGVLETREGKAKACQYCSVANLCNQRKRLEAFGKLA